MKREGLSRVVFQCLPLEPRLLLCLDGDTDRFSTIAPDPAQGTIRPITSSITPASIDTLIVPAYSSRPGADRKIFLDFNGHTAVDNWGGWWEFGGKDVPDTQAYDVDGDPNTFSQHELDNILTIWKGVAEKFSPFDVDVTTIKPSKINGAQVVIGGNGAWNGGGGGVGIVDGWGEEGFTDANAGNIAWVWDGQNGSDSPNYIVEAASHETGHTLGLYHVSLAPIDAHEYAPGYIMGSGTGGIGRWTSTALSGTVATTRDDDKVVSKGNQDELATIVSGHGFGYRADDVGGTIFNATPLPLTSGTGVFQGSAQGVIETSSDIDVYQITTNGGSVDIQVLAAEVRPMLDPQLALRDSSNNNIALSTSNTGSDGIGEKIHINQLNAGTYYIVIGGSGTYGDMGQYRLNVVTSLNGTANNDSLSTATGVGVFGQTDASSVAIGLGGTAVINDSLFGLDSVDYFKFRVPANTNRIFVSVDPNNNTDGIVLYDDFNGNGVIDAGETLAGTKSMSTPQSFTFNLASGYETYYVRVSGGGSFNFGAYQLRIAVDAAPDSLPPSVASAGFDPQPLVGGRTLYDSIDFPAGDTVDYYRVKADTAGLFTFYLNPNDGDPRLDIGTDTNGNGVLDAGEILATSAVNGAFGQEYIQNFAVTQGQQLLVRVMSQVAGGSTNYTLQAIADYATGGNMNGALPGARDLTLLSAGSLYEYLDSSVDFYDTFKIAPPTGQFQAKLTMLEAGASHMLQIIRDGNNNGVVDSVEIVASGYTGTVLTYNITSGAAYYLRVMSVLAGEFYSVGNYKLSWAGANTITGWTLTSPANIPVGPSQAAIGGYLAYDPTDSTQTNLEDYYRFTLNSRQRFDVYTNPPAPGMPIGVQVGQLDGSGNFVRLGGAGAYDHVVTSLSLNLDPGTYYIRTFLPVAERQQTPSGGNYGLFFKTAAITDNSPPLVTAAIQQFEVAPLGIIFTLDQDVLGSVDASDVVVKNLATNVTYPIGKTFYDPATHRAGYGIAAGTLPDGNYRATLLAGSLKDASLNPLAADYKFDFYVLAGDANRDRKVDAADLGILSLNWQGTGKTFSQGDFNYDGKVDINDLYILSSRWKQTLAPPPPPAQPVSINTGAPRRTATRVVNLVQED